MNFTSIGKSKYAILYESERVMFNVGKKEAANVHTSSLVVCPLDTR